MKYVCPCGYVYDPEVGDPDAGIAPGTAFEDIPDDWVCPWCGLGKDAFEIEEVLTNYYSNAFNHLMDPKNIFPFLHYFLLV